MKQDIDVEPLEVVPLNGVKGKGSQAKHLTEKQQHVKVHNVVCKSHPKNRVKLRGWRKERMWRENLVTFENVFDIIGRCGRWQIQTFFLGAYGGLCTAIHQLIYGFIGTVPDHWCQLPNNTNVEMDQLKNMLIPKLKGEYDHCSRYGYGLNSGQIQVDNETIVACDKFTYNTSQFSSTIPSEVNFNTHVCGLGSVVPVQSAYMLGVMIGAPLLGGLSDYFGRKRIISVTTIVFLVTSPVIAFLQNFWLIVAARFMLALSSPGLYATSYVLVIEVFPHKLRAQAGNLFNLPFACGYLILPLCAYFISDWRTLQLVLSIPCLILLLTCWNIPESPRWLIRKGRLEEAEKELRRAASINGREETVPSNFACLIQKIYENEHKLFAASSSGWSMKLVQAMVSIVRSPKIRIRYFILCICWFAAGMTYYGLALNGSNLSANLIFYIGINGLLEFPAYILTPYFVKVFGRKRPFVTLFASSGVALLATCLFSPGSVLMVLLSFLGKFLVSCAFSLVYLYASELMPTTIRTYAIGLASMAGRLGSTMAPYVVTMVGASNPNFPSLVFGCVALVAGLVALVLPETQHTRLPETIEQVEKGWDHNASLDHDEDDVH